MIEISYAPWSTSQIENLNDYQASGFMHPYTCCNTHEDRNLIATRDGFVCRHCDYTQNWAYGFTTDGDWRRTMMSPYFRDRNDEE